MWHSLFHISCSTSTIKSIGRTASGSARHLLKDAKYPSCMNCVHYIEFTNDYPWDDIPTNKLKKCGKFSGKNKLTGETKNVFISVCREDKNKCGEQGRFFEPNVEKVKNKH